MWKLFRKGFSPGKYETHRCTQCQQSLGTLQFDVQQLKNVTNKKDQSKLVCKDCQKKLRCAACQCTFDAKEWTPTERYHHSSRGSALVCAACRKRGYHPQDVRTYTCDDCSGKFGAKHFDAKHLKNHNTRGGRLQCNNCSDKKKENDRQDTEREKRIKNKLRGKNVVVTADDLEFLRGLIAKRRKREWVSLCTVCSMHRVCCALHQQMCRLVFEFAAACILKKVLCSPSLLLRYKSCSVRHLYFFLTVTSAEQYVVYITVPLQGSFFFTKMSYRNPEWMGLVSIQDSVYVWQCM